MATTVGQHSVAAFTSPVNGTTPIDANSVRGNDNTMRSAYVDHDADTGIHVQSSTLASRPAAGTAGRKWITEDSGIYTLWFDDGVHWHPVSSEAVAITVLATENLVKGDVVKVVGWNNGQDLAEVAKTTSASDVAFAVITATVSSGVLGYATNTGVLQDINTNAYAVGTVLYPNASGGFTSTKPTSGNYQPVAYVLRQNTNNGVIYVEFSAPRIVERSDNTASTIVLRDSNGDFSAGTITATAVNATTLDLTNLEVTNIKAKDGTQAIAIADATGKLTISDGVLLSGLTASQAVFTDSSKNLISNAITGAGNVVMSASPTLTGTVTAATLNATTLGGTLSTAAQPNVTSVGTLTSLTVSGNLAVDTDTLYVDATNNRVGIGTASPVVALDVAGSTARIGSGVSTNDASLGIGENRSGSGYAYIDLVGDTTYVDYGLRIIRGNTGANAFSYLQHRGTGELGVLTSEAAPITFYTSGTEKMRLDASGNLGLGVTPSAWSTNIFRTLQVGAGAGSVSFSGRTDGGSDMVLGKNLYNVSGTFYYVANGVATMYRMDGGTHSWNTAASGTAGNAISFTQAMTLDASGNLGIGTTSPSAKLHTFGGDVLFQRNGTAGIASISSDTQPVARLDYNAGAIVADWTIVSSQVVLRSNTNYPLVFATNSTERARITSGGYFKASNDGTYIGSTASYHENRSNTSNEVVTYFSHTHNSTPFGLYVQYTAAAPNGTSNSFLYCQDTSGQRAAIRSNGGLANYQSNNVDLSDARTKTDITPAASMWDKVAALEIVAYKYIDQTHDDVNLGVIAQQVETVEPVWVDSDGFGDTPEGEEPFKTVYTKDITFAAIKALQEAMARIESLEARLAALES